MADMGGFLKGAKFASDASSGKTAQFAIEWGRLTDDPTVKTWGDKVKTEILIKTYTKTYQRCAAWGQGPEAVKMSALSKDDEVVVIGRVITSSFTNKSGEEKETHELAVYKVFLPSEADLFLLRLMQSKKINAILDSEDEERGEDAFESEADFYEQDNQPAVDENGDEFMDIPDDLETPFM